MLKLAWRRALLQATLLGLGVWALEFDSGAADPVDREARLFALVMFVTWTVQALPLALTAQWVEGRWSGLTIAALFGVEVLVLNLLSVNPLEQDFAQLVRGAFGMAHVPRASYVYSLWLYLVYGGMFFVYCLLAQRSLRVRGLLARAEFERGRSAAEVNAARAEVLEGRIDPALLLRTLAAVRQAYATNRQRAEDTIDALVAFLRLAMPALRSGKSTLLAELSLLRAYAVLVARVDTGPALCHLDAEQPAADLPFPPLLLIPLLDRARAVQPAGAPAPRVALNHDADARGMVLTIEASTPPTWLDDTLAGRLDRTLRVLYAAKARWHAGPAPSLTLWLPLPPALHEEDRHARPSNEQPTASHA